MSPRRRNGDDDDRSLEKREAAPNPIEPTREVDDPGEPGPSDEGDGSGNAS